MEKIQSIGIVFILASLVYLGGFLGQKSLHVAQSGDIAVKGHRIWRYILGTNDVNKIYLRPASLQCLGMLYFILGIFTVLVYDVSALKYLTFWLLVGGGVLGGIVWFIIDRFRR